jgi:Mn2+/Fe2+ NRAMP family transporter
MKKMNKLRKVYLWYLILTGELVCAAIIICAGYIDDPAWLAIIRIAGIVGAVIAPVMIWVLYRWIRRDNADTSDELEQMVLLRALAVTGLVAMSLVPVLLLLVFLLPEYAGFTAFGYTVVVWGAFKLTTFCLYRRY